MSIREKTSTLARAASRRSRTAATGVRKLSWGERLSILDALSQVLDGVYAHLPLKRSLYGFDVVRGLEHLRMQLPGMSDLQFHRELTTLVNRLRDAHTQYQGPWTVSEPVASLPFLIESFGPEDDLSFVVSKVDRRSVKDPYFVPGVTIDYWNGIPFERALDLHAEVETGGRPDSRRARALESLTFRSLEYSPPPDEEWVVIGYRDRKGKAREIRLHWHGIDPKRSAAAGHTLTTRSRRAINPAAEAIRRAKKYRFNHALWRSDHATGAKPVAGKPDRFADFITGGTVSTRHGRFGYLRLWSFDVDDDQAFVDAAIAILRRLPDRGLIIDLRNNPGGLIWAAERLLQLFTPYPVAPTRFALRATPLTSAMARADFNRSELAPWAESLFAAETTGEPYSSHLPITSYEQCNDIGQQYGGPIVVVVDANTYSSGDLFAAGVVDNRIGPVVCIGQATGAGGANVWDSEDLRAALAAAERPMPDLPPGVGFTVAVRRAVRSGSADGTLIEDAGIAGQPYCMTRDDIFRSNRDLIEHCGQILAAQPLTRLKIEHSRGVLRMQTQGLDVLDVYVDGHPAAASIRIADKAEQRVRLPRGADDVLVMGYRDGVLVQRRHLSIRSRR